MNPQSRPDAADGSHTRLPAVTLPDATWSAATDLLTAASRATLVCHVQPDGDALGSMLGLARVLRQRGVEVTCTFGDEHWRVPPSYTWLPGADRIVPPGDVDPRPDLLVVLDTGSRDRLGVLAPLADAAADVLVIDHHAHNHGLGGVHLIDPMAASTTTVVEALLARLGVAPDLETATCLYIGLVTDTGGFAHSVTTPAVHQVAARLLAVGVRPDEVQRRLWGSRPFGYVCLLATALSRAVLEPGDPGMTWTWTTWDDVAETGIDVEQVDGVIDTLRLADEADIAVVLKGDPDGSYRVSMRSRGDSDVGAACLSLGGGGHRLAAGFTSRDDVTTTMRRVRDALSLRQPVLPGSAAR